MQLKSVIAFLDALPRRRQSSLGFRREPPGKLVITEPVSKQLVRKASERDYVRPSLSTSAKSHVILSLNDDDQLGRIVDHNSVDSAVANATAEATDRFIRVLCDKRSKEPSDESLVVFQLGVLVAEIT